MRKNKGLVAKPSISRFQVSTLFNKVFKQLYMIHEHKERKFIETSKVKTYTHSAKTHKTKDKYAENSKM